MAFDLEVHGFAAGKAGSSARKKVQKLVDRHRCEAWGQASDSFGVGMGRLPEKKAKRFFSALVDLAKAEKLTVHDPQAGRDVFLGSAGELPPGWGPPKPMDPARFAAAVKRFGEKRLKSHGFLGYDWGAQRHVDEGRLLQRIAFRADKDAFTAVVDWRFIFDGEEDPTWPAPHDLAGFIAGTPFEERWPVALKHPSWGRLSAAPGDLERSLAKISEALEALVLPLLDSIASIEDLVAAFEDGRLGTVARQFKESGRPPREAFYMAFGYSPVGTARNMALSYAHLGRLAEGKRRYEECLAELGDPASLFDEAGRAELAEAQALFG